MVSSRLERIADTREHAGVVMPDPRGLAVRWLIPHHLAAERLTEALVAEPYAEDCPPAAQVPYRLRRNTCLLRCPRAGRDDDSVVVGKLTNGHRIVAMDDRLDS